MHAENTSGTRIALHRYAAAVFVHDLRHDGEAKAHSLRASRKERIEDALQVLPRYAAAAIDHRHLDSRAGGSRLYGHSAPGRGCLGRVEQQVIKHPLHELGVQVQDRNVGSIVLEYAYIIGWV